MIAYPYRVVFHLRSQYGNWRIHYRGYDLQECIDKAQTYVGGGGDGTGSSVITSYTIKRSPNPEEVGKNVKTVSKCPCCGHETPQLPGSKKGEWFSLTGGQWGIGWRRI